MSKQTLFLAKILIDHFKSLSAPLSKLNSLKIRSRMRVGQSKQTHGYF